MTKIMDEVFIQPVKQNKHDNKMHVRVQVGQRTSEMIAPVPDERLKIKVSLAGNLFVIDCTTSQVRKGISINVSDVVVKISENIIKDDLNNYVLNFLNWYFPFLVLKDAIAEGNMFLTNITLKFMVPLFFSRSSLSKYMTECLDYILKTEVMLSPQMAMKVRAASFANPKGKPGHNKAADMQKENEVLLLKNLIKGRGAQKTEKSIVKVSKTAQVIDGIVENLILMTKTSHYSTHHMERSIDTDLKELVSILQSSNPWKLSPGRHLEQFPGISASPFSFDIQALKNTICKNVERLRRGVMFMLDDDDEGDDDACEAK